MALLILAIVPLSKPLYFALSISGLIDKQSIPLVRPVGIDEVFVLIESPSQSLFI